MSTNNETKSLHVIILCNKSGKASLRCKNPSVRGLCPFLVLYERKSYIGVNKLFRNQHATNNINQMKTDMTVMKDENSVVTAEIGQAGPKKYRA